ncbi:hypothetical protein pb186bvf_001864 [Paramecium bursaria]
MSYFLFYILQQIVKINNKMDLDQLHTLPYIWIVQNDTKIFYLIMRCKKTTILKILDIQHTFSGKVLLFTFTLLFINILIWIFIRHTQIILLSTTRWQKGWQTTYNTHNYHDNIDQSQTILKPYLHALFIIYSMLISMNIKQAVLKRKLKLHKFNNKLFR